MMERLVFISILMVFKLNFIVGENDDKVKRLLLNDPDVVGHISSMQNNINSLTLLVSQLTSKLNTVESELAAQKTKNTGKETCIAHLDDIRFSTIRKTHKDSSLLDMFSYVGTTRISSERKPVQI